MTKRGFTMMEMLVVFILIAVLAQVAIVTYRRSIEDSKRDKAKAILEEIATANARFRTDYPSVLIHSGPVTSPQTGQTCNIDKFGGVNPEPWMLIACGYLEDRTWWTTKFTANDFDYGFYVCGDGSEADCAGGTMSDGSPAILAFMRALSSAGRYYTFNNGSPDVCHFTALGGTGACN